MSASCDVVLPRALDAGVRPVVVTSPTVLVTVIVVGFAVMNIVVPSPIVNEVAALVPPVPTVLADLCMVTNVVCVWEITKALLLVVDVVGELGRCEDVASRNVVDVGLGERRNVVDVGDSSGSPSVLSCLITKYSGVGFLLFQSGSILEVQRALAHKWASCGDRLQSVKTLELF